MGRNVHRFLFCFGSLPITDGWQGVEATLASKSAGLDPALCCFRALRFLLFLLLFQWSALITLWWCAFRVRRIPLLIGTVFFPAHRRFFFFFVSRATETPQKFYQCALRFFVCFSEKGESTLSRLRLHLKRLSQCCSVREFVACIAASSEHCVVCCSSEPVLSRERPSWLLVCRGALLFLPPLFGIGV